jgi:hypothetical protein
MFIFCFDSSFIPLLTFPSIIRPFSRQQLQTDYYRFYELRIIGSSAVQLVVALQKMPCLLVELFKLTRRQDAHVVLNVTHLQSLACISRISNVILHIYPTILVVTGDTCYNHAVSARFVHKLIDGIQLTMHPARAVDIGLQSCLAN